MDFLFELLFEIIIEGSLEIGTSRKVPLLLRILALLVFLGVFGGVVVLLFLCGFDALREKEMAFGVFCLVVSLLLVLGSIYMVAKRFRR